MSKFKFKKPKQKQQVDHAKLINRIEIAELTGFTRDRVYVISKLAKYKFPKRVERINSIYYYNRVEILHWINHNDMRKLQMHESEPAGRTKSCLDNIMARKFLTAGPVPRL